MFFIIAMLLKLFDSYNNYLESHIYGTIQLVDRVKALYTVSTPKLISIIYIYNKNKVNVNFGRD